MVRFPVMVGVPCAVPRISPLFVTGPLTAPNPLSVPPAEMVTGPVANEPPAISSAPPDRTSVVALFVMVPGAAIFSVPAATVVLPLWVFAPDSVQVPVPILRIAVGLATGALPVTA